MKYFLFLIVFFISSVLSCKTHRASDSAAQDPQAPASEEESTPPSEDTIEPDKLDRILVVTDDTSTSTTSTPSQSTTENPQIPGNTPTDTQVATSPSVNTQNPSSPSSTDTQASSSQTGTIVLGAVAGVFTVAGIVAAIVGARMGGEAKVEGEIPPTFPKENPKNIPPQRPQTPIPNDLARLDVKPTTPAAVAPTRPAVSLKIDNQIVPVQYIEQKNIPNILSTIPPGRQAILVGSSLFVMEQYKVVGLKGLPGKFWFQIGPTYVQAEKFPDGYLFTVARPVNLSKDEVATAGFIENKPSSPEDFNALVASHQDQFLPSSALLKSTGKGACIKIVCTVPITYEIAGQLRQQTVKFEIPLVMNRQENVPYFDIKVISSSKALSLAGPEPAAMGREMTPSVEPLPGSPELAQGADKAPSDAANPTPEKSPPVDQQLPPNPGDRMEGQNREELAALAAAQKAKTDKAEAERKAEEQKKKIEAEQKLQTEKAKAKEEKALAAKKAQVEKETAQLKTSVEELIGEFKAFEKEAQEAKAENWEDYTKSDERFKEKLASLNKKSEVIEAKIRDAESDITDLEKDLEKAKKGADNEKLDADIRYLTHRIQQEDLEKAKAKLALKKAEVNEEERRFAAAQKKLQEITEKETRLNENLKKDTDKIAQSEQDKIVLKKDEQKKQEELNEQKKLKARVSADIEALKAQEREIAAKQRVLDVDLERQNLEVEIALKKEALQEEQKKLAILQEKELGLKQEVEASTEAKQKEEGSLKEEKGSVEKLTLLEEEKKQEIEKNKLLERELAEQEKALVQKAAEQEAAQKLAEKQRVEAERQAQIAEKLEKEREEQKIERFKLENTRHETEIAIAEQRQADAKIKELALRNERKSLATKPIQSPASMTVTVDKSTNTASFEAKDRTTFFTEASQNQMRDLLVVGPKDGRVGKVLVRIPLEKGKSLEDEQKKFQIEMEKKYGYAYVLAFEKGPDHFMSASVTSRYTEADWKRLDGLASNDLKGSDEEKFTGDLAKVLRIHFRDKSSLVNAVLQGRLASQIAVDLRDLAIRIDGGQRLIPVNEEVFEFLLSHFPGGEKIAKNSKIPQGTYKEDPNFTKKMQFASSFQNSGGKFDAKLSKNEKIRHIMGSVEFFRQAAMKSGLFADPKEIEEYASALLVAQAIEFKVMEAGSKRTPMEKILYLAGALQLNGKLPEAMWNGLLREGYLERGKTVKADLEKLAKDSKQEKP